MQSPKKYRPHGRSFISIKKSNKAAALHTSSAFNSLLSDSFCTEVNGPVQFNPVQSWKHPSTHNNNHTDLSLMSKTHVVTSTRISLLVSTQFSSGKVSHKWSKVVMLSLKPNKFNLLKRGRGWMNSKKIKEIIQGSPLWNWFSILSFCALKNVTHWFILQNSEYWVKQVWWLVIVCWPADSSPGLLQAIHSVGLQGWKDGPQRGEILQLSALLQRENTRNENKIQVCYAVLCSFMSLDYKPLMIFLYVL